MTTSDIDIEKSPDAAFSSASGDFVFMQRLLLLPYGSFYNSLMVAVIGVSQIRFARAMTTQNTVIRFCRLRTLADIGIRLR